MNPTTTHPVPRPRPRPAPPAFPVQHAGHVFTSVDAEAFETPIGAQVAYELSRT